MTAVFSNTISCVSCILLHAHYLALIIFNLKHQFCAINSSDILNKYPCLKVTFLVRWDQTRCLIMSVKYHLSLPQIPWWCWIQWTVHKLRHHKSGGGGDLLWCQLQFRGLLCSSEWWKNSELSEDLSVQFSFFRPTLCKHHEWMSINLLHSDYVTWYRNFANKMLLLSSSFSVPAKNRRNTYDLLIILLFSFPPSSPVSWKGSWTQPMPGSPLTHYFHWNISGSNLALLYERSHEYYTSSQKIVSI